MRTGHRSEINGLRLLLERDCERARLDWTGPEPESAHTLSEPIQDRVESPVVNVVSTFDDNALAGLWNLILCKFFAKNAPTDTPLPSDSRRVTFV